MVDHNGEEPGWIYKNQMDADAQQVPKAENFTPASIEKGVEWTAAESVTSHKNFGWFLIFFGIICGIAALAVLLTKDIFSAAFILVAGVLFAIIAKRPPRQLTYHLDNKGVAVSEKFYPYAAFKSFAISREGALNSVVLMPLHRFQPELTFFLPPEQQQTIVDIISNHLPNDQSYADRFFERLTKNFHF